jgi:NAD(P)H-dependent FMN reductase
MSREIILVAGSPSSTSRSSFVAQVVAGVATRAGLTWRTFSLGDFEPADVLYGRGDAPATKVFLDAVKASAAIVLATPVYKATYAGGLKAIVDLIPPDALVGRPALGIATTKLHAHGAEVEQAYKSLFAFFRTGTSETIVVLDDEFETSGGPLKPAAAGRVDKGARALIRALEEASHASTSA